MKKQHYAENSILSGLDRAVGCLALRALQSRQSVQAYPALFQIHQPAGQWCVLVCADTGASLYVWKPSALDRLANDPDRTHQHAALQIYQNHHLTSPPQRTQPYDPLSRAAARPIQLSFRPHAPCRGLQHHSCYRVPRLGVAACAFYLPGSPLTDDTRLALSERCPRRCDHRRLGGRYFILLLRGGNPDERIVSKFRLAYLYNTKIFTYHH